MLCKFDTQKCLQNIFPEIFLLREWHKFAKFSFAKVFIL